MIRSGRDIERLAYTYTARLDGIDTGKSGEFASHARLRTCRGYRRVPLTGYAATKAKAHVGCQVDLHCEGAVCVLVTPVAANASGW